MKITIANHVLIIAVLIAFSCHTTTTIDLPENPPKLTLNCIGASGEPWRARLTSSKSILEFPSFESVQNAIVTIYENNKIIETLTYGNFGGAQDFNFGSLSYFPTPGKIYRVDVSTDLYGSISAEYFQPLPVAIDMVVLKTLGKNPSIGENVNDVQYKVTFTDPPEENFYQIIIKRQSDDSSFPQSSQQNNISFIDPAYKEANEIFGQYSTMCFTDSFFNDKKTSLDFKSFINEYPDRPLNYCSIYLNNISKEYYYYLKTFYLQDINLDDPFAQPVQVVNNIQNGFGIFAGYTQTVKTFKVTD